MAHSALPRFAAVLVLTAFALAESAAALASFEGLGFLPGGDGSIASAVSADGSVVVGSGVASLGGSQAFRWTSGGGMVVLGALPGGAFATDANGVSADGSVVVGLSSTSSYQLEAFRWTSGGGMGLGQLSGGSSSSATGVSSDGSVVVGSGVANSSGGSQAFRWTSGSGMVGLDRLPGSDASTTATGVSADGSVIVGFDFRLGAFRWTVSGGAVELGTSGFPRAVSADGLVVVGEEFAGSPGGAFRWTLGDGAMGLGVLPGFDVSRARGTSADGSVVVGTNTVMPPPYCDPHCVGPQAQEAFIWDATHGMRSLQEVLTNDGLDLTGWTLQQAASVSADGRTIVGFGIDPSGHAEGWIATIPDPPHGPAGADRAPRARSAA